jgi:hypothetical protein
MAKLKSPRCSTGHGTGVTPPVSLAVMLERDRVRLAIKRALRPRRYSKVIAEQVDHVQRFLASREYRNALRFLGIRTRREEEAAA